MRSRFLRELVDSGQIKIVGAEYSIETGVVDFYLDLPDYDLRQEKAVI
jgi:hypothetical protein